MARKPNTAPLGSDFGQGRVLSDPVDNISTSHRVYVSYPPVHDLEFFPLSFHHRQGCGRREVKVENFRVGARYEHTPVDSQ